MEIRKCKENDSKEVYKLMCELENTTFNYKEFEIAFNSKINNIANSYFLCVESNQIIGFLSLNIDYQLHHAGKVATIEELIISSKFRNIGAGKLLLENAIKQAKKKHCEIIELTSNFSRERAHNFYIKNGFKKSSYKFQIEFTKK